MKKWPKRILIFFSALIAFVVLVILLLHTGFAKRIVRNKLEAFLSGKTKTEFHIGGVNYLLPKWVELNGVFVKDLRGDTLLWGKKIRVDIRMLGLIKGEYDVRRIELDQLYAYITKKQADTTFNYQFLIDAFTSKEPVAQEKKDTSALALTLRKIEIRGSRFSWLDESGGLQMTAQIGSVAFDIDSIDFKKQVYAVKEGSIENTYFNMQQRAATGTEETANTAATVSSTAMPVVKVKDFTVRKSAFNLNSPAFVSNNIISYLALGKLDADLNRSMFLVDKAALDSSNIVFVQRAVQTEQVAGKTVKDTALSTGSMLVQVNQLDLKGNQVAFDNGTGKVQSTAIDYNHLLLKDLLVHAKGIYYAGSNMKADISRISFRERSGFVLDTLQGNFGMDSSKIAIAGAKLITPHSKLFATALVYPRSLQGQDASLQNNEISIKNTVLSKPDLFMLAPGLAAKYRKELAAFNSIYLNGDISGTREQLNVRALSLQTNNKNLQLFITGKLKHPLDTKRLQYDAEIHRLIATRELISPWVNKGSTQQIDLPPVFSVSGHVNGNMSVVRPDLRLQSSYGEAEIKGMLAGFDKPAAMEYNMQLVAKKLETGKWIKKDSLLGPLTGTVVVKGRGTDYKTASITSHINFRSFRLMEHDYQAFTADIDGRHGLYAIKANSADPLLDLSLDGTADVTRKYPSGKASLDVRNADLTGLGLTKDSLRIQSEADITLNNADPGALDVHARLDTTRIYRGSQQIYLDSLVLKGFRDSGLTFITLRSDLADASLKGEFDYTKLPAVLTAYVNKYRDSIQIDTTSIANTSISMQADVKPNPVYAVLLPGLFFDKNIHVTGELVTRNADSSFYVTASVPYLKYQSNVVSALQADIRAVNDSLRLAVVADTIQAAGLLLYKTTASGELSNRFAQASVLTHDAAGKERYRISLRGNKENDNYALTLGDTLRLNYNNWNVRKDNRIVLGSKGFNISQLEITNGAQRLSANSETAVLGAPLKVEISKFRVSNIAGILDQDSLSVNGLLDVNVRAENFSNKIPTIDGTIKVDSLTYNKIDVGNIAITANGGADGVNFNGGLTGNGNNVDLKGSYTASQLDASINLNPVKVKTFEAFSAGTLARSGGNVSGPLTIKGPVSDLSWSGKLRFDSVNTSLAQYGTVLKIDKQEITLSSPEIRFNKFTIRDSADHTFQVDGTVRQDAKAAGGFTTDLSLNARNFIAVNNTAVDNNEIYGTAIVNVDATIAGPLATPDINGNVRLRDESSITYARQPRAAALKDREGVIEFIDLDSIPDIRKVEDVSEKKKTTTFALNYNLNIEIDPNAQLSVIIDPATRDELIVKGSAQLNAGVTPNGEVALTGAYNLTSGSYQLNYQFLRRRFELQEGSTIMFSGDPREAEANITAMYEMEAEPLELIGNEIESGGTDNANYRQKFPFQVILKVKGPVTEPRLEFDIKLKEGVAGINSTVSTTIENKLAQLRNDASSMNKQVFALLVMNRFIGEQSKDFFAGSGNNNSNEEMIRASVSGFLSEVVNQLAADLIKGVDIDVNLKSVDDYATATQRTDLNLALSKRFLDDRLSVMVGKNFTVDGEDPLARSQNNSNLSFLPDITTNYKLSRNGRYMLKAYRRTQYEAILDGYFVETGVAFSISLDYVKFRQIFNQLKKKKNRKNDNEKER
ncbi:translocation/assembly module TamB domain-containing protein [Sediminibacterium ginsengisoli]|uniref:Autotransporter translocation and assembly factor TamB n=1 Tax=Sediminibacterium ginsengisoli TaxID=413434 RepID=A0A1T4Q068_9BACT|nr:translocation/assembly module TamB domain-containing protein [Sediminibacterium ginsengisoli]SJZ97163.1 Autotransporter translocation and assembly factor TamB [Sediminibacterium ginsengisoli]